MPAKIPARFTNEEAARKYLEAIQWPDGPVCPHCGVVNEASRISGGRNGLMFCNACRKQFTVTVGTVFERSKVPLNTWLYATHLLCSSKKGISSHQLARTLGVTYKTAWFMAHRIREAMKPTGSDAGPLGGEGKIVEADEAYIGKKDGKRKAQGAGGYGHKRTVLTLVERGGKFARSNWAAAQRRILFRSFRRTFTPKARSIQTEHRSTNSRAQRRNMRASITPRNMSAMASIRTHWKAFSACLSVAWSELTSIAANSICSVI